MIMRTRSIAFRVASLLILGMALMMITSTVLTLTVFLNSDADNRQRIAIDIIGKILQEGMQYSADGELVFKLHGMPAKLFGFADAQPQFWYLLSDGTQSISHGTVPPMVRTIIGTVPSQIVSSTFNYSSDGRQYLGLRIVNENNPGQIITFGGVSLTESQTILSALWGVWPQGLYHLLAIVLIATTTISVVAVKRTIASPVRRVVDSAEQIDGLPGGRRISDLDTPAELKPMVAAFNTALTRIDNAFEAQRNFLASASHELRTPLTKLRIKLDLVEDKQVRDVLVRDTSRLASIVTTSLQLARLSGQSLSFTTLDLTATARGIVGDHVPSAISHGIEIEFKAPDAAVLVSGSEPAIRVALENLIVNALRHARGTGALIVEVLPSRTLQVTDYGPGIQESEREAMLRPFTRGNNGPDEGTGMGLAIVAQIMTAHGGTISLGDTSGRGLVISLAFPDPQNKLIHKK